MQQFWLIAAAHFLALISPGPDFFLVARTSMIAGWKVATGACLGIALANGLFIVMAFAGVSFFSPDSTIFVAIQLTGCLYLLYMGGMFIRHAGTGSRLRISAGAEPRAASRNSWWRGVAMGFLSAILNPKNALFYVSIASVVSSTHTSEQWKLIYSVWMFSVVLLWDVSVAAAIGNKAVLHGFSRALPVLERVSGAVLILIAVLVAAATASKLSAAG
jgi:threonine/homoserine/homoserine lactone efflux protein